MSLNIKNEEVCALARRAAELAGTSQTNVVEQALRRFIVELESTSRAERVADAVSKFRQTLQLGAADLLWQDFDDLYDESGAPR